MHVNPSSLESWLPLGLKDKIFHWHWIKFHVPNFEANQYRKFIRIQTLRFMKLLANEEILAQVNSTAWIGCTLESICRFEAIPDWFLELQWTWVNIRKSLLKFTFDSFEQCNYKETWENWSHSQSSINIDYTETFLEFNEQRQLASFSW